MLLKALDLLRTLGWGIIHFIYSLIDSLFDILRGLNAFDIINSVSGDNNFITFQKSIMIICIKKLLEKSKMMYILSLNNSFVLKRII